MQQPVYISSRTDIETHLHNACPDIVQHGLVEMMTEAILAESPDYGEDWAEHLAEMTHSLRVGVLLALADVAKAQQANELCGLSLSEHVLGIAEDALASARAALVDSDCPRSWDLIEEGCSYDTVTASSAEEALEEARSNCDGANYPDVTSTLWLTVMVRCPETGEEATDTVTLHLGDPGCQQEEHYWCSPLSLVGGLDDNPGVRANGGAGVLITEVCRYCATKRVTDTWAQRPDTGGGGFTKVSYEQDAFTAEQLAEAFGS